MAISNFLARQIEKSYVVAGEKFLSHPHYLTPVAPSLQVFFYNIDCIGRHVARNFVAKHTRHNDVKTFKFKMADAAIIAFC